MACLNSPQRKKGIKETYDVSSIYLPRYFSLSIMILLPGKEPANEGSVAASELPISQSVPSDPSN